MRRRIPLLAVCTLGAALAGAPAPAAAKPHHSAVVHHVPKAFWGRWDEQQGDKCRDRESRYSLQADGFETFETASDVTSVTVYSPTEIDIHVTLRDEKGKLIHDVVGFRLVDGGRGLVDRPGGRTVYRRCPDLPEGD